MKRVILYLSVIGLLVAPAHVWAEESLPTFEQGMEQLASELGTRLEQRVGRDATVAVVGFIEQRTSSRWLVSDAIEANLTDNLLYGGNLTLLDRSRIDDVIKQQIGLENLDPFWDSAQAAEFGRLSGAKIIITGTFSGCGSGSMEIRARALELETAIILAAHKLRVDDTSVRHNCRPRRTQEDCAALAETAERCRAHVRLMKIYQSQWDDADADWEREDCDKYRNRESIRCEVIGDRALSRERAYYRKYEEPLTKQCESLGITMEQDSYSGCVAEDRP